MTRKSAEQGDCDAQYKLGKMYREGKGVIKDPDQAKEWWIKAAGRRKTDAQKGLKKHFGQ